MNYKINIFFYENIPLLKGENCTVQRGIDFHKVTELWPTELCNTNIKD